MPRQGVNSLQMLPNQNQIETDSMHRHLQLYLAPRSFTWSSGITGRLENSGLLANSKTDVWK